jgi:hypothetical protein
MVTMTERAEQSYHIFRGGFRTAPPPPHWEDLEPWMRDAVKVAYLQGKLDGAHGEQRDKTEG